MTVFTRREWILLACIFLYSFVPNFGGLLRIAELSGGPAIIPANPRALAAPLPIVLHIAGSFLFCMLGAAQFMPSFAAPTSCLASHRRQGGGRCRAAERSDRPLDDHCLCVPVGSSRRTALLGQSDAQHDHVRFDHLCGGRSAVGQHRQPSVSPVARLRHRPRRLYAGFSGHRHGWRRPAANCWARGETSPWLPPGASIC